MLRYFIIVDYTRVRLEILKRKEDRNEDLLFKKISVVKFIETTNNS